MRVARYWTRKANINLIPLIDVLVNLIFFFIVFGSLDKDAGALPVKPPASRTAPAAEAERFVVALAKDGRYTVDGRTVAAEALPGRIADALARNPLLQVVLVPDSAVPYQSLVSALDLIREGGAERPALGVRRSPESSSRGEGGG